MRCVTLLLLSIAELAVSEARLGDALAGAVHDEKIIGGSTAHIDDVNFMVQVILTDPKTSEASICGGSLLSDRHVLTAGHCVPDQKTPANTAAFTIVYGASERNAAGKNGAQAKAAAFQRHPKYVVLNLGKDQAAHYDVAVIRLRNPVTLGPKVGTIKITAPNAEPKAGSQLSVSGWGVYKVKPVTLSRKLRTGSYKVGGRASCLKAFGPKQFTRQEICVETTKANAYCLGDSGGPGYQGKVQYSVVSTGSCGTTKPLYGLLANLADPEINKFIQEQLKIK